MKMRTFIAFCVFVLLASQCECKGGRGGFSSRGGSRPSSSGSRPSSSGGWFSSKPAPAPSYRPSPSYNPAPAPSYKPAPSYGWNVNSPSSGTAANSKPIGWNVGNTQTVAKPAGSQNIGWNVGNTQTGAKPAGNQNIGWNTGSSNPVGPPPAYPGLGNRPAPNAPPAYSPSYNNPPAYNPSYTANQPSYTASRPSYTASRPSYSNQPAYSPSYSNNYKPSYNTYGSNPGYNTGYNTNYRPASYGSTFGSNGLGGNTYISNNYYGGSRSSGGSGFLTNALFYGAGMHHGYMWGGYNNRQHSWSSEDDRKWRSTTKAPYFENKVPGSESYLPAAAVVGAATAFGLASLLPLNVPSHKPLMYCNITFIAQTQIKLDDNIYSCTNQSVAISCPRSLDNETIIDDCLSSNKTMECGLEDPATNLYCTNGTLISRMPIVCNSTTVLNGTNVNETTTILNCYHGQLPDKLAAFIPTTSTEAPVTTTTERSLSMGAKIHVFFLKLIGKGDVLQKTTTTTTPAPVEDDPRLGLKANETAWIPEALTIAPDPNTTTTTEVPTATEVLITTQISLTNDTMVEVPSTTEVSNSTQVTHTLDQLLSLLENSNDRVK